MKLLEEAFTPPPNYEEAETWLTNNQFIGKNALHEDGYPGRAVYAFEIPKTHLISFITGSYLSSLKVDVSGSTYLI